MNVKNTTFIPNIPFEVNPIILRRWWLRIDKNERVLSWSQTYGGQTILHVAFCALIFAIPILSFKYFVLVVIGLSLVAALPAHRLFILCGLATVYFVLRPFKSEIAYDRFPEIMHNIGVGALPTQIGISLSAVLLLFAVLALGELQNKNIKAFPVRRPILSMFLLSVVLTVITALLPKTSILSSLSWAVLALLSTSFFFIAYIFLDNRGKLRVPVHQRIGFVRPLWTTALAPMKGPNFIKKFEAKDSVALSITRLKAVKLVLWAAILFWVWELGFNQLLFGYFGFPRLNETITLTALDGAQGFASNWLVLIAYFMAELMEVAVYSHLFVAIVRMAGFQIPRGMFNPLASRSISEFWGRYLFYFKEMLADIFFYPTFQRFFKKTPRLRIAFATFVAAFLGNILFDVLPALPKVATDGIMETVDNFYSYTLYAAILTIGLIVSQLSSKRPRPEDGNLRYNILPRVQVIGFFMILQVFDDSTGSLSLEARTEFFLSLFGVWK
ncbi:hypothetical protein [Lentilitoribacter sp. EG35]|uniref:hypothetical protein n=1 Tax=Lentilitoribacter sp. EG35 TaxID=3234192 RepID=UPI00346151FA